MSLRAYQQAAAKAENPREVEYRLFGQVTRALIEASMADSSEIQVRMGALDWNRRLWRVMADDCLRENNPLPEALRAQIVSISLWVNRHSSAVMRGQERFDDLIEVNRSIMQGLLASPEGAAKSAG